MSIDCCDEPLDGVYEEGYDTGHEEGYRQGWEEAEKKYLRKLSMRDHFAMAALTGLISYKHRGIDVKCDAEKAYKYADEMIAARKED